MKALVKFTWLVHFHFLQLACFDLALIFKETFFSTTSETSTCYTQVYSPTLRILLSVCSYYLLHNTDAWRNIFPIRRLEPSEVSCSINLLSLHFNHLFQQYESIFYSVFIHTGISYIVTNFIFNYWKDLCFIFHNLISKKFQSPFMRSPINLFTIKENDKSLK